MKRILLFVSVLMLSGCLFSTPKSSFYILEKVNHADVVSRSAFKIGVQDVSVPDYLLRSQIVLQQPDSPKVDISEFHRWASDLSEMLQNTLILDMQATLPRAEIKPLLFGDNPNYVVKINLEKMIGSLKHEAQLSGTWQILSAQGRILKQNRFNFSEKIGSTYASYVKVQSALLARLSVEISQTLSRM